jgi:hypothetical protein
VPNACGRGGGGGGGGRVYFQILVTLFHRICFQGFSD